MPSVAPESAQHSSSSDCDVKSQASGELSFVAAKEPIDEVTDDEMEESSGAMRSWMVGGWEAGRLLSWLMPLFFGLVGWIVSVATSVLFD